MSDLPFPSDRARDWNIEEWGDLSRPVDPDVALFAEYMAGELSMAEREAFKRRMATDAEFAAKIGPLASALALVIPFDPAAAEEAFGADELDAMAGVTHPAPPAPPTPVVPFADEGGGWGRFFKWTVGFVVATVFGLWLLVKAGHPVPVPAAAVGSEAMMSMKENAYFMATGKWIVIGSGPLVQDTTGPNETILVRGNGATDLTIRPNSWFAYRTSKSALETFDYGTSRATIEGEVRVSVLDKDLTVDTRQGTLSLDPGEYVIRSVPHGTEMLVSVGSGSATITPSKTNGGKKVVATRGDYVRVPAIGPITIGHDSTEFPKFVLSGDSAAKRVPRPTEGTHPVIPKFQKPKAPGAPATAASGAAGGRS